jgi:Sodium:alanine symporter family
VEQDLLRSAACYFGCCVTLMAIVFGAMSKLTLVWAFADMVMALMAIVNLVAICLLGKWVFAALKDYHRQFLQGKEPVFVASEADLPGVLGRDIWETPERRQVGALPESLRIRRPFGTVLAVFAGAGSVAGLKDGVGVQGHWDATALEAVGRIPLRSRCLQRMHAHRHFGTITGL